MSHRTIQSNVTLRSSVVPVVVIVTV